jgi:hypothetical protein
MTDVILISILVLNISILHLPRTITKPQRSTLSIPKKEYGTVTCSMVRHKITNEIALTVAYKNVFYHRVSSNIV